MGLGRIALLFALMTGLCAGPALVLAEPPAGDEAVPVHAPGHVPGIGWFPPAGCPDREWLLSAIERHQGGPLRMPGGFFARV